MLKNVTDTVFYVGVDDKNIDLFENQYIVPNGIAYNSYVIMDEKIAIMDMVDAKCADQWFANVAEVLGDRKPDYLVISHLEPDHSANLGDRIKCEAFRNASKLLRGSCGRQKCDCGRGTDTLTWKSYASVLHGSYGPLA